RPHHALPCGLAGDQQNYTPPQPRAVGAILIFPAFNTPTPASPTGTGNGAADLLLGAPISGNISIIDGTRGFRRHELGFYAQDDWKFSPRLTLNLGLRYELYPSYPWVEVADRGAFLDLQTLTVCQLGAGNISRTGVKMDRNNFAPRVGLAYKLTNKTVLRSAYGVFYAAPQYEISRGPAVNPPFAGAFSFNN